MRAALTGMLALPCGAAAAVLRTEARAAGVPALPYACPRPRRVFSLTMHPAHPSSIHPA
jgi:hypothetical protein